MKKKLDMIRKDMNVALAAVGRKHGLEFKIGSMRYTNANFNCRIEGIMEGLLSREAEDYQLMRKSYGLPPLGAEVTLPNGKYTIAGFKKRAPKNPIIIARVPDGKTFVTSPTVIQLVTGRKKISEVI